MSTTGAQWIEQFAVALGVDPPTAEEVDQLLAAAGIAAHTSERTAAPISTWLAGRAGVAPGHARELAAGLAARLGGEPPAATQAGSGSTSHRGDHGGA